MSEPYKPVPVEVARAIAEDFDKSIVIIFCHDPVHGLMHTTTFGIDAEKRKWAAEGGEIATRALGGVTELATSFEDYRLTQARKLLAALKSAIRIGGADFQEGYRADIDAIHDAVKVAEECLG
jgi:hypothetical protein